jgi:hypothetical protein
MRSWRSGLEALRRRWSSAADGTQWSAHVRELAKRHPDDMLDAIEARRGD